MKTVEELFTVEYGHGLALNKLKTVSPPDGVNFVSRSALNNGVAGRVALMPDVEPAKAGTISVAVSGSVMESFVQPEPYYTAFHVMILTPREKMTLEEKLWWALCLKNNKYRYNYGRQANRTLGTLELPDKPNFEVNSGAEIALNEFHESIPSITSSIEHHRLDTPLTVGDLFDVKYGHSLELNRLKPDKNGVNFVSRTQKNNGVSGKVKPIPDLEPAAPQTLSVALGGSVLETFIQPEPYYCGRDVAVLTPKRKMSESEMLWWALCIKSNRYRFNYGRQANRTLKDLPVPSEIPQWVEVIAEDAVTHLKGSLATAL